MKRNILSKVEYSAGKKILGVGAIVYDMLAVIPHMPAWEEVEYIEQYDIQQGGMAATGIVTASKLGAPTEIIGVVGNDFEGEFSLSNLEAHGVEVSRVARDKTSRSAITVALIHSSTGRRTFIHYKGVNERGSIEQTDINLTGISHILLDGFFFDTALQVAQKSRENDIITVTDLSPKNRNSRLKEYLNLIDYPILSELFVCPYTNINDSIEAAKSLLQDGNKALILTCGEKGAYIITSTDIVHVDSFDIDVVDSTGAGDVFHGGFIFGLWYGFDVYHAVIFASACSAITCTKVGGQSGIPNFTEVRDFIHRKSPNYVDWIDNI
jgi:sulfofructose kinase